MLPSSIPSGWRKAVAQFPLARFQLNNSTITIWSDDLCLITRAGPYCVLIIIPGTKDFLLELWGERSWPLEAAEDISPNDKYDSIPDV
mmetsp:Transcript_13347/g.16801  ORF Transcript_13347/g.16801 Transcript_13347/m.16801 type:complete len:88 (-) Transcript_13347:648-911(-)